MVTIEIGNQTLKGELINLMDFPNDEMVFGEIEYQTTKGEKRLARIGFDYDDILALEEEATSPDEV